MPGPEAGDEHGAAGGGVGAAEQHVQAQGEELARPVVEAARDGPVNNVICII